MYSLIYVFLSIKLLGHISKNMSQAYMKLIEYQKQVDSYVCLIQHLQNL